MPCDNNTTPASSPLTTEQINAIMASLPPTKTQEPTSSHSGADAHNASILAVRGLHTTATGNDLLDLADMALLNFEIPAQLQHVSGNDADLIAAPGTDAVNATVATSAAARAPTVTFKPFYFFFYGSLQIPDVLQSVCEIEDKNSITLQKNSSIEGWKYKMWGPYPALVPAAAGDENGHVEGTLWFCEKPEHVARLCTYETDAYRMAYCNVLATAAADGTSVVIENARTFVFNQNYNLLEDGNFNVATYSKDLLSFWY
ncbi:hypothetical protein CIB48_g9735 [Xylaria polymorpha]|nr:hypothetical protein CIB48_g9735 [Xylaria polymorpha]